MSAQMKYGFATGKGIAGGIFDMYHYPVDSRFNEEANGKLRPGMGVVQGTVVGSGVKLPTGEETADKFEGVVVNGFTNQHDLEGRVSVMNNANIGVMRKGRIWVALAAEETVKYGDPLKLVVESGEDAGLFATSKGIEVGGRFIGPSEDGLAPAELTGVAPSGGGADMSQYQKKITATGILKGDGNGGISAASEGTDYSKVAKLSDLSDVDASGATEGQVLKYNKSESKWKPGEDSTASEAV